MMKPLEDDLAAIGIPVARREPRCWRVRRTQRPRRCATTDPTQEPSRSQSLSRWRDLLARDCGSRPYRIYRVGG